MTRLGAALGGRDRARMSVGEAPTAQNGRLRTGSVGLGVKGSQVQILSSRPVKPQVRAGVSLRAGTRFWVFC